MLKHAVLLWACDSKMMTRYIAILLILSNQVKSDIMDKRISVVAFQPKVSISHEFLTEDGVLTREIMPDLLHPKEKGYAIWAEAIEPTLARLYDMK